MTQAQTPVSAVRLLAILALAWLRVPSVCAQCAPAWSDWFGLGEGPNLEPYVVHDEDGPAGPKPAAIFGTIGLNNGAAVAKWDGHAVQTLGTVTGTISSMVAFDEDGDGPMPAVLYVAGDFDSGFGLSNLGNIARWDGTSWRPVGAGVTTWRFPGDQEIGSVQALHVHDPDGPGGQPPVLYVGGWFYYANGIQSTHVARWNGVVWNNPGFTADWWVYSFETWDDDGDGPNPPALYIGGGFQRLGGVLCNGVARWDGAHVSPMGAGIQPAPVGTYCSSLHAFDPDGPGGMAGLLFAGLTGQPARSSDSIGGVPGLVAAWNGAQWILPGSGVQTLGFGGVNFFHTIDFDGPGGRAPLMVAGFTERVRSGSLYAGPALVWDGSEWGLPPGMPPMFDFNGPRHCVNFQRPSHPGTSLLLQGQWWDGEAWTTDGLGIQGTLSAMTPSDPDGDGPSPARLYIAGDLRYAAGRVATPVISWDGGQFRNEPGTHGLTPTALGEFDPDGNGPAAPQLVVAGRTSAGLAASVLVDGAWNEFALPSWFDGVVRILIVDPDGSGPLPRQNFLVGRSRSTGGRAKAGIARWSGTAWEDLSFNLYGEAVSLVAIDDDGNGPRGVSLVVGGVLTASNGIVRSVNRLSGAQWVQMGTLSSGSLHDMTVFDPDGPGVRVPQLIVATDAAGAVLSWSGSAWQALGQGLRYADTSWDPSADALVQIDPDGPGPLNPRLYVAGSFDRAGSAVPCSGLALWDGQSWAAVTPSFDSQYLATAYDENPLDDAPPAFYTASGSAGPSFPSVGIARYGCAVEPVRSDLTVNEVTPLAQSVGVGTVLAATVTVRNAGQAAAVGPWMDAVYLSRDRRLDPGDRLLAAGAAAAAEVPVGETYTEPLSGLVPPVLPGAYYVLGFTDAAGGTSEADEDNNLAASALPITVSVPTLLPGQSLSGSWRGGEFRLFHLTPPHEGTVLVALDTAVGTPADLSCDLRVVPAANGRYFSGANGLSSQRVVLPAVEPTDYYVLLSNRAPGDTEVNFTISATFAPFDLRSSDRTTLPNVGTSTLRLEGSSFPQDLVIQLVDAENRVVAASVCDVVSAATALSAFSLNGLMPGRYALLGSSPANGQSAVLSSPIDVQDAASSPQGGVRVALHSLPEVRANSLMPIEVSWSNESSLDYPSPVIVVRGSNGLYRTLYAGGARSGTARLLPGDGGSITDSIRAPNDPRLTLTAELVPLSGRSIDWTALANQFAPRGTTPEGWGELVARGSTVLGPTWDGLLDRLSAAGHDDTRTYAAGSATFGDIVAYHVLVAAEESGGRAGHDDLPFTSRDDVTIQEFGNPAATKVTVVFHGRTSDGDLSRFETFARLRAEADNSRVIVVRAPGADGMLCGAPWECGPRFGRLGESAYQLLRQAGVDFANTTMIGESNGNALAKYAAERSFTDIGNPTPVERLIHANPPSWLSGYLWTPNQGGYAGEQFIYRTDGLFDRSKSAGSDGHEIFMPTPPASYLALDSQYAKHGHFLNTMIRLLQSSNAEDRARALRVLNGTEYDTQRGVRDPKEFNAQFRPDGTYRYFGDAEYDAEVQTESTAELPLPVGSVVETTETRIRGSADPNEIVGPAGSGAQHWTGVAVPWHYTVRFENLPGATAPAAQVVITQTLDPSLDPSTFRLGAIAVGETQFDLPSDRSAFAGRFDFTRQRGVYLDVDASVDFGTGAARWTLTAIDPVSQLMPADPDMGFLPPNTAPPLGEGYVTYTARPRAAVQTGTRVDARAQIVFDYNDPIDTAVIFNTVDRSPPQTGVDSMPSASASNIPVAWYPLAAGDGASLDRVLLYVSEDGGPFTPWAQLPANTPFAVYHGTAFHRYHFQSYGLDAAGNVEPWKAVSQASSTKIYDMNVDGVLNAADYSEFLDAYAAGLVGRADVNGDGRLSADDVAEMRQAVCRSSDFNNDGFLDFFDYDDFVSCFEGGGCPPERTADFNGDGFADFFDYDDFVGAFEVGC